MGCEVSERPRLFLSGGEVEMSKSWVSDSLLSTVPAVAAAGAMAGRLSCVAVAAGSLLPLLRYHV
jgi:hypothetical protein